MLQEILTYWNNVREGFIHELELVPEDKLNFRATPETRTILELMHHVLETEMVIGRETCQENPEISMARWGELLQRYAPNVKQASGKQALLDLLDSSIKETLGRIEAAGEVKLQGPMRSFDGKEKSRLYMLQFLAGHEMYHRGQLTVLLRLLGIEPALTRFFKKMGR